MQIHFNISQVSFKLSKVFLNTSSHVVGEGINPIEGN